MLKRYVYKNGYELLKFESIIFEYQTYKMLQLFSKEFFRLKKYFLGILVFGFSIQFITGQEAPNKLTKYSHSQFISKLTSAKDSAFSLKNAFIYFDREKDSSFYYEVIKNKFSFKNTDTLTIDVNVVLKNVHFEHIYEESGMALHHIKFTKTVEVVNASSLTFSNCVFEQGLYVNVDIPMNPFVEYFEKVYEDYGNDLSINESEISGGFQIDIGTIEVFSPIFLTVSNSLLNIEEGLESAFYTNNIRAFDFFNNTCIGNDFLYFNVDETWRSQITNNNFNENNVILYQAGISSSSVNIISNNLLKKTLILEVENFNKTDMYHWNDWEKNVISHQGYSEYLNSITKKASFGSFSFEELFNNDSLLNAYKTSNKYKLESSFKSEKRLIGTFYDFYKSQYDTDFANKTYVTLKDIETKRYQYLHEENPSFKTYFTWKINKFLKDFSDYGTDPSKSIIISIYVILIFALIYLLFPNSWDTINKNRLMKRIRFYTRYFRNKESMKEIYDEEKKQDLMTYYEFKEYMNQSQKETPSYFLWLAKPLYYFSSTNYKLISNLLNKTDVLKGKWVDLPKKRKFLSSILMGIWIVFLLFFDIFIKFLNALTLSINTFTTLGFGEIPTTGIPRYLCIIQGFIGWFMLSIFSVALISQLLN